LSGRILGELLEDLDGLVVEVNLIKLFLDSELDVEFFSECPSSRSMELESSNVVVLSAVGSECGVVLDLQWDIEAQDLERSDLEIDWYNCVLENFSCSTGEYTSEDASWLVGLLGVVLEVNSGKESLSWCSCKDFSRY